MKKKKKGSDLIKMKFGKISYDKDNVTNFTYAWLHPIISCRLSIKYFVSWAMSMDYSLAPTVYRYFRFFFTLVIHSFMCCYIGMAIGVLNNDKADGMRLVTEIPLTAGMAFISVFGLLMFLRFVIYLFELIRLFKEDSLFLYGIGVAVFYGFQGIILLGITTG
jgi:hypothetical protein